MDRSDPRYYTMENLDLQHPAPGPSPRRSTFGRAPERRAEVTPGQLGIAHPYNIAGGLEEIASSRNLNARDAYYLREAAEAMRKLSDKAGIKSR